MAITLYSLGAAQEVTGSKHVLETGGGSLLVDCGAFQGRREEADRRNRDFSIDTSLLSSTILTHAHYDHCGLLPVLAKKGYRGNIYATPASRDLASIIMMDSAKIQARDAEYLQKQARKRGKEFTWQPLFGTADVMAAVEQFVTLSYHRTLALPGGIGLEFYDAGHILGSAMAYLTVPSSGGEPLRVGFTGDLGRANKPIIRDPELIPDVDYLVLESTYGNRLHESADDALGKLAEVVSATARRGGKVVVPAFAIERTQEIVFYLHLLVDRKKIPEIPIFVDSPMATNATAIFQVHPECYDEEINTAFTVHHRNPFGFNSLRYTSTVEESKELNSLKGPAIIVSADGMCEAGRIQHHLAHTVEDARNTVLLVGYMAENTLGRKIEERQPEVRILGESYRLRAEVAEIGAFSAHADYAEMWSWVSRLDRKRLKGIFLVHGEPDAQGPFRDFLLAKGVQAVTIVKYGERYPLAE